MKKHKFNYLPDANDHDFQGILESIKARGFDAKQPVTLYQGDVLDGWQRQRACDQLGAKPTYKDFTGTDLDALDFVRMMAERRNLNSGQKAACAAEAQDLMDAIAGTQPKGGRPKAEDKPRQKIAEVLPDERKTSHKLAESFGTNRTYVNQARKIKEAAPEIAEKVKAGKMTHQDAMKAVRAIPVDPWSDDEKERKAKVESGIAVVANQQLDKNLIQWAERNGKAVRVDRGTLYGNPFVLGADGDRDAVCDAYAEHYLPHKPSIVNALALLKGKVLICHCYPERCHGNSLIAALTINPQ